MASAKAIALMESIYSRVDKQVRDILATLPGVTVPAQQDGSVVSAQRRIFNFEGPGVVVTDDPSRNRVNVFIPGSPTTGTASEFYSNSGSEKVFPYGTAPANWQTNAFSDTAWANSTLQSQDLSAFFVDVPGLPSWIVPTTLNGDNGATDTQFLARRHFLLPAGSVASATLEINYDDDLGVTAGGGAGPGEGDLFVNGHRMADVVRTGTPLGYGTLAIPIAWLIAGADNVLAVNVFSQAGYTALIYRITINMSEAGVDGQYQLLSEKGDPSGYAGLGAGGLVPTAQLGTGSPSSTTFLRGDQTYATVSTASISIKDIDGTPTVTATVLEFPNGTLSDQGSGVARYTAAEAFAGLTTASAALGSPVTMTTSGTFYDGASVSLAAGTWLINAAVTVSGNPAPGEVAAKLWDGTTVYRTGETFAGVAGSSTTTHVSAIVVLGSTTTVKVSGACQANGASLRAALIVNGSGNNCTYINAVQIV